MPFTVTQHDGVCSPTFDAQGSCARGVIVVMGDLLFAQLLSSAFVSSSFGLVMETSTAKHAKSTAKSMLRRSLQRGSRAEEDEDTEEVTELDLDKAEGEIIMYVARLVGLTIIMPNTCGVQVPRNHVHVRPRLSTNHPAGVC